MAIQTVKAIINGQTITLSRNSSNGKYEATITAPSTSSYNNNSGHYYPVTIQATDTAGNIVQVDDTHSTFGNSLKLQVKEKVAPILTITSPTEGAMLGNNKPTITWTATDNDSGINANSIRLTIDSEVITTEITKTVIDGGYSCSYIPNTALSDGTHTIKVDVSDNDGNTATQRVSTFTVDTIPPTLSVESPVDNLVTNNAKLTVSGVTNDLVSSPCVVTIQVNSNTPQATSVDSNGAFSREVTLANGTNTIIVTSTDAAGKSTTVTRTVTLDTVAPVIHGIIITPNPVDAGQTYIISVDVTD